MTIDARADFDELLPITALTPSKFSIRVNGVSGRTMVLELVRGKGMDDSYVAFWLSCPSMTNPAPPQLRMGTRRSDGKIHLEFDVDEARGLVR